MSRILTIQPSQTDTLGDYDPKIPMPYPWHIEPDGSVARQDFWDGSPARLAGFQRVSTRQHVDLLTRDWLDSDDPDQAVGMWPVFLDLHGSMWTDMHPIAQVIESQRTEEQAKPEPAEPEQDDQPVTTYTPVPDSEATSLLGEGIHTGLRKATFTEHAEVMWKAISDSEGEWSDALAYAVEGLEQMGYAVCKKVEEQA